MIKNPKDRLGFSIFSYAIRRVDGKFYTAKRDTAEPLWTDKPMHVYTYAYRGAEMAIAKHGLVNCDIVLA